MGEAAGNGTQAAIAAGYSPTTARQQASRLLTKDDIRRAIEERSQGDELTWTREQRQAFWSRIAGDAREATRDRLKASELLARSQGDFIEKRLLQLADGRHLTLAELIAGPLHPEPRPVPAVETLRAPAVDPPRAPAVTGPPPAPTAFTGPCASRQPSPAVGPESSTQRLRTGGHRL